LLTEIDVHELEKIEVSRDQRVVLGTSSKGTQLKWISGNYYIKLDLLGYESTAEVLVGWLLRFSKLPKEDYIIYKACAIYEDGRYLGKGCYCKSFLKEGEREVSVANLLDSYALPYSLGYDELREELFPILGFDLKKYVDKILCLDAITRNDDRHYHNISFIVTKDGIYRPGPIFDNGSACMSDMVTYPLSEPFESNYQSIYAKPFQTRFEKQIVGAEPLRINAEGFLDSIVVRTAQGRRALATIARGLKDTEGLAWIRC